ncbi:9712_t:CDS:2, partial [Acaulospora colombiana]
MDITGSDVHVKDSPSKADVQLTGANETMKDDEYEDVNISALVGLDTPLEDFKAALASGGDIVSEAVAQLSDVIKQLALAKHFPNRRKNELLEAMKFLRETCLMEDEIVAWNEFIRELKQACLSTTEPGNKPFWEAVKKLGNAMTLIGKSEATKAFNPEGALTSQASVRSTDWPFEISQIHSNIPSLAPSAPTRALVLSDG